MYCLGHLQVPSAHHRKITCQIKCNKYEVAFISYLHLVQSVSILGKPAHRNLDKDPPESPRLKVDVGFSERAALALPSTREHKALTTSFSSDLTMMLAICKLP